jgi:twitching motility protein PilT
MSHLENFLDILLNWQGEKLVLSISEQAYIVKENQKVPVLKAPLAGDEIEFIKTEYRKKYGSRPSFKYKDKYIQMGDHRDWLEFRVNHQGNEITEEFIESSRDMSGEFDMNSIIIPFDETSVPADGVDLHEMLRLMANRKASDLHLSANCHPVLRIDGLLETQVNFPQTDGDELLKQLTAIAPPQVIEAFRSENDTCFSYEIQEYGRYRVNISKDHRGIWMSARHIPLTIPTVKELDLPDEYLTLCDQPGGLVLITGPTGSGKTTTLASMIQHINHNRQKHIVTFEDPVEFVHYNKLSLINQRDLSHHVKSLDNALKAAYNQGPDIIVFGDVNSRQSIVHMLEAAISGHLVMATITAPSPTATIEHITGQFESHEQKRVVSHLADCLSGILSQTLTRQPGANRTTEFESLIITPKVSNLIREGNIFQISSWVYPNGDPPLSLAQHEI